MKVEIEVEFEHQEIVYVKTDEKQLERIVTAWHVSPLGVRYQLAQGTNSDYYYDFEISKQKSFLTNKQIGFKQ